MLTRYGMEIAHQYAVRWHTTQTRYRELELMFPELVGLFYDIRNDDELAAEHAIPFAKSMPDYYIGVDPAEGSDWATYVLIK